MVTRTASERRGARARAGPAGRTVVGLEAAGRPAPCRRPGHGPAGGREAAPGGGPRRPSWPIPAGRAHGPAQTDRGPASRAPARARRPCRGPGPAVTLADRLLALGRGRGTGRAPSAWRCSPARAAAWTASSSVGHRRPPARTAPTTPDPAFGARPSPRRSTKSSRVRDGSSRIRWLRASPRGGVPLHGWSDLHAVEREGLLRLLDAPGHAHPHAARRRRGPALPDHRGPRAEPGPRAGRSLVGAGGHRRCCASPPRCPASWL